jgi:Domain of unknown function (DUF4037)
VTATFRPGLELAGRYYADVVRPLLDAEFPGLRHSAGLIGWGSDVLGYDSPRSTDHNWGPRCQVFLGAADADRAEQIAGTLAGRLPAAFEGWPTVFPDTIEPDRPPRHWIRLAGLGSWLTATLGFDPRRAVTTLDWLATPTQLLAEVTAGAVFHDGLESGTSEPGGPGGLGGSGGPGGLSGTSGMGGLGTARARLAWYPPDVWRYVLACQWRRIGQEEAFPGRCAEAGDELGSAVVTARLVRDLMRLVLLMRRRYPPYSKWLGTALARAGGAAPLLPLLSGAIAAGSWPEREGCLNKAYQEAARMHNELGLTRPVDATIRQFHDRPFYLLGADRFADALREAIGDPRLRRRDPTGAADQFIDSTDALGDVALTRAAVAAAGPAGLAGLAGPAGLAEPAGPGGPTGPAETG